MTALDNEFTRVYDEYTRRVATIKALSENIIQLWVELGTPQAQTDAMIVKHYRDAPEQLGLHEEDLARMRAKRDKLSDEKKAREKRLNDLKVTVEGLWERLGVEEFERKKFLNSNRGCGVRQINEFEDELSRLNELKRQNLHLFVEDARYKLQELWDGLYFSEEEMLEFTPAFSDVFSDALLEAHEQEIRRLEALKDQRAPTLSLIDQHRSLVKDRDDLQASSQDASRLMMRGQKGEKRDPTRLLREEKTRKRIGKDLPKIASNLKKTLENWENEYSRPFLVHGERYLDKLEASEAKPAPGPRSKTPAGPPLFTARNTKGPASTGLNRANSAMTIPPPRTGAKTPIARGEGTLRLNSLAISVSASGARSPSKIPARGPLSNLNHGGNSPERRARPESRADIGKIRGKMAPPPRPPPPPLRDFIEAETPVAHFRTGSAASSGSVRHFSPEDVYFDGKLPQHTRTPSDHEFLTSVRKNEHFSQSYSYPSGPPSRQISNTSAAATTISGSENVSSLLKWCLTLVRNILKTTQWETYDDVSEPEQDATNAYYAKLRAIRGKRFTPDDGHAPPEGGQTKKQRGISPGSAGHAVMASKGNRIVSNSEASWTDADEDAF